MEKIWLKNYPEGVAAEINNIGYYSISDLFEKSCKKFWDKPAFTNFGTTLTFHNIYTLAHDFASYLAEDLKLEKGSRIAIMLPNLLQYPIAMYGAFLAGLTVVNVNPLYTSRELKHQLEDSGAKCIVIFENSAHLLENIIQDTVIEHIIVTRIGDCLSFPKSFLLNFALKYIKKIVPKWKLKKAVMFNKALKIGSGLSLTRRKISLDDIAYLQYTGGTTGVSKGAILTHGNILANVTQAYEWIKGEIGKHGQEIIITPLPLYHIFSLTANCLTFFKMGALNVLITNPRDIKGFVKTLSKYKFTALTGVNTLFNGLIQDENFKKLDFSALNCTLGGGMAVQRSVAEQWHKITGKPILEAYGLTESSPAAVINPTYVKEYNGSIGLPISSMDVKIIDEAGSELPIGQEGELCLKGPNIMQGYWNRPEETKQALSEDGWFKTGDIAKIDDRGFLYIVDRKKDMILVSGFNVFPNEIEDVIASHPDVLEVAAIGVPDERSGEIVKIFVVRKNPSLTEAELKDFAHKNFTGYKRPKLIEFREELPKSNIGKILRRELRDEDLKKKQAKSNN